MDLINFRPGDVRGGGNIVSPSKTLTDFDVSDSVVTSVEDTVDGKTISVFNLAYRSGSYLTKSGDGFITYTSSLENINVEVILKTRADAVISSASVTCTVNEDTTLTATTNSSGKASFSIPYSEGESYYRLRFTYAGTNSVAGCSIYGVLVVGELYSVCLIGDESKLTQTGSPYNFISRVTGKDLDGNITHSVGGQTVELLAYNPRLFGRFNTILDRSFDNPGAVNKTVSDEYLLYTNKYVAIGSGLTNSIRFNRNTSDNVISVMVSNVEVLRETLTSDYLWVSEDTLVYNGDSTFDISSFDFPVTNVYGLYGNGGTVTVWDLSEKFGYNATYITETLDTTGVTFANSDSSTRFVWANPTTQTTDSLVFYGDITCDFDFISYNGSVTFMLVNENSESFSKRLTGSNCHIRLEYTGGVVHWFVDDVEDGTGTSFTAGKYSVRIYLGASGSVKIKDFVIGGF